MLFPLERGHGRSSFSRSLYISVSPHLSEAYSIFGVAVGEPEDKASVHFARSLSSLIHLVYILVEEASVVLPLKRVLRGGT